MKLKALFFFLLTGYSVMAQKPISPDEMFNRMMQGIEQVRTATYLLEVQERVFTKNSTSNYIVKLQTEPLKIYTYCVKPNPGAEALYVDGKNSNKILINPNRFPYINISLSVNSMLLRKNHQYNMKQLGFDYLHDLLGEYDVKLGKDFRKRFSTVGTIQYKNKEYYQLEILNPDFGYVNYTVVKGDNVSSIARKFLCNDHMILEVNPDISDYDDVSIGQVIKVPNSFAKKITFYIDKVHFLPLVQIIYDEQGFYTKIEFSSFVFNPMIKDEEFTKGYPKYHF